MNKSIRFIGITAAAGLFLWGCSAGDFFGEYSGESFLTTSSLADDQWQLMPDFSFETGTTVNDYMDFSLDSASGGPNGGPSYRLEIKNLLANGDFDDGTSTGWYFYDFSAGPDTDPLATDYVDATITTTTGSNTMDGNFLRFTLSDTDRLGVIFDNTNDTSGESYVSAFLNTDTYIDNKSYVFSYRYRTASVLTSYYQDNWDGSTEDLDAQEFQALGGTDGSADNKGEQNYNYFPPLDPDEITDSTDENGNYNINYNVITADNSTEMDSYFFAASGNIDDVTFVRDSSGNFDLRLKLQLKIDHRSDLDLIPGYYKFSLYVKEENSGTSNVFEADRVELGITGYDLVSDELNSSPYTRVFYKSSSLHNLYSQSGEDFQGGWDSSSWTQLSFASDELFQLPDISDDYVMELTISPSNPGNSDASWNRLDAGSILIAEPTLEYSDSPWD